MALQLEEVNRSRETNGRTEGSYNSFTCNSVVPEDWPENDTPQREAAIFYSQNLGLPIFPVDAETKKPRINDWPNTATRDEEQVEAWWQKWPTTAIGLVCGPRSGVAVLDIDVKSVDNSDMTGADHISGLKDKYGTLGSEVLVTTPSGGQHVYYRADSLPFEKSEGRVAPGVDVRSARPDCQGSGYIILPPSPRENGTYEWGEAFPGNIADLPAAPDWIARLACFNSHERQLISQSPDFLAQLTQLPRAEWRQEYEAWIKRLSDNQRSAKTNRRKATPAGVERNGITPDHPYIRNALEGILSNDIPNAQAPQNTALFQSVARAGSLFAACGLQPESPEVQEFCTGALDAAMGMKILDPSRPWNSREGRKTAGKTIKSGLTKGIQNSEAVNQILERLEDGSEGPDIHPTKIKFEDFTGKRPDPGSTENIMRALRHEGIGMHYDELERAAFVQNGASKLKLNDEQLRSIRFLMHKHGLRVGADLLRETLLYLAEKDKRHPIRSYFDSLSWDGKKRLSNWLANYAGSENNAYTQAIGRAWMIGAVRRARQPGCKFDAMLVLEGPQGLGKSSLFRVLATDAWFTDDLALSASSKELIEQTEGSWIVEIAELSGMGKRDVEAVKAMISRQSDKARGAYAHFADGVPRQFVLCGTTNDAKYLRDATGNRRFWCVRAGHIALSDLRLDRGQLWAEAAYYEAQGEAANIPAAVFDLAAEEQDKRLCENPIVERIVEEFENHKSVFIPAEVIWKAIGLEDAAKRTQVQNESVSQAMARLGRKKTRRRDGGTKRVYGYENAST